MKYPKSDNYDGSRFHNPEINNDKSLLDVLGWKIKGQAATWPDWVEIETQAPAPTPGPGEAVTTYINHATHLIQISGMNMLTDPIFSQRASPVSWAGPARVHKPAIALEALPKIHVVMISHNHYDHMDVESIRKLSQIHNPVFVVPLGNKELIEDMGAQKIVELDWWQDTKIENSELKITLVPVQHWSARGMFDRNKALWGGFVVQSPSLKIFFAGDTGYNKFFLEIKKRLGIMDLSILPIGAYEPRWFMKEQHMNPEDAVQAHVDLESRFSLGTHFGTFQLTDEAIDEPRKALSLALQKRNLSEIQFAAPTPGASHLIKPLK